MNDHESSAVGIKATVIVIVIVLAWVSVILLLAGFTDFGQTKTFRLVASGVMTVTAIAHVSLWWLRGVYKFLALFGVATWLFVASLYFAMAIWLTA